jgi:hypothetical protein
MGLTVFAVEKLERYKFPGPDEIPAEIIQAGGRKLCLEITHSVWNKGELPQQWKESISVLIFKKMINLAVLIIEE